MNIRLLVTVFALMCAMAALPTAAQPIRFWQTSVLADFSDAEVESFKATINKALEQSPDTEIIEWTSPSGKMAGKIRPRYTYESNGLLCRRTSFQVSEDAEEKRKENYRFDICKGDDGWGVYTSPVQFTETERKSLDSFLRQVLDNEDENHPIAWHSQESQQSVVIVLLSAKVSSEGCRNTAAHIDVGDGHSVSGNFRFCKSADKEWHYLPEAVK